MEETLNFGISFLKMVIVLGIVCLLAYIIKWTLPKSLYMRGVNKSLIKIVDCFRLEPKKTLYIVEIEGKYLLLGSTDHCITPLTSTQLDEDVIKKALSLANEKVFSHKRFFLYEILKEKLIGNIQVSKYNNLAREN